MSPTKKRIRRSFGGRWTDEDRDRLWKLRNAQQHLTWQAFAALYFPNRSVGALQTQYSDTKLRLMNPRKPDGGNNVPLRSSTRLNKRPSSAAEHTTGEPAQKQTKISEPDVESSTDESSDEDAGDLESDGRTQVLRSAPRKQNSTDVRTPPHRPGLVTLQLQPKKVKIPNTTMSAEKQPEDLNTKTSDPKAQAQVQEGVTPQDREQPMAPSSSIQTVDLSEEPEQSDKPPIDKSSDMCTPPQEDILDKIGDLFGSWAHGVQEHRRADRRATLRIERLKKELGSEKDRVSHLEYILGLRERERGEQKATIISLAAELRQEKAKFHDLINEYNKVMGQNHSLAADLEEKKTKISGLNTVLDQKKAEIDALTGELHEQKAKVSQMSSSTPGPAQPCPGCAEKEQQLHQIQDKFEMISKVILSKAIPPVGGAAPSTGE
ncbi:hypothetical protein BDV59DRAFT_199128 [Aspergillus ambiguus]|uniref:uncharacterized protein n=1 Tax=Aspergillus ambiguus TaxID=176160 RepID=UPI003CCDFF21